jgi:diketogulonate reductase-like aldo/keto reductase
MMTCEPSLALSIVSGSQTDALVSDYSSKNKSSTGQMARWQAPAVESCAGGSSAPAMARLREKAKHLSMLFRELGKTGIRLPEIGLGTWNYSGGIEPLRAAIECGARLIDTAESYGTEEIVGEAIKGRRHQVFLATKVLPRNFRRRDLIVAAERSLRRLGTDHIDLYQLHWPNLTIPIEDPMRGMEELVDAGKVRFIGVSNFIVRDLIEAQAALGKQRIVANQVRYSLVDRTIEGGLLQYCQKNGITVIAYSPLASGVRNIRAADPDRVLRRVAQTSAKSEAQVALNWCISKENVIAIPKASTVAHVMENVGASGWKLQPELAHLLEKRIRYRRRGALEMGARRAVRWGMQKLGRWR